MILLLLVGILARVDVSAAPESVVVTMVESGWSGSPSDGCECLYPPLPISYI